MRLCEHQASIGERDGVGRKGLGRSGCWIFLLATLHLHCAWSCGSSRKIEDIKELHFGWSVYNQYISSEGETE